MKKIKILFLTLLVLCILAMAVLAPVHSDGRFILPVGYCKYCMKQMDRA